MGTKKRLAEIAQTLVSPGKGILAADESIPTITKRFDKIGVESTEETRKTYREILLTTPGMEDYISGVILFDETTKQSTVDGVLFPDLLKQKGVSPGIKVDEGLEDFGELGEKVTKGLEGLPERFAGYAKNGLAFSKWRAVFNIGNGAPTGGAITKNAENLAEYAVLSQEAGLAPILEPEVLIDGDHPIEKCRDASSDVLKSVFLALKGSNVELTGMLLKVSMVTPGQNFLDQVSDEEIARTTMEVLLATVPPSVPGIVFLSGGQTPEQATGRLNTISRLYKGKVPWELSFSFSRALQGPVLEVWRGKPENVKAAQEIFFKRARLAGLARSGSYSPDMEK